MTKYAKISRIAALSTARPFELTFQDGTTTRVATRIALRGAMPKGFKPPTQELCTLATRVELPDVVDYSTESAARSVLNTLMPGHWHTGYAHALIAAGEGMDLAGPTNAEDDVKWLLTAVDMSRYESLTLVGMTMSKHIEKFLKAECTHMDVRTLTDAGLKWHLHPGPYRAAKLADKLGFILVAPSQHVTDIVVAMSLCMPST